MRVAIIAAAVALASSSAMASPSCMTQSEARAKFPKEHLWWHGSGRCWDATPPSRARLDQRNKARAQRAAEPEARSERDAREDRKNVSHAQQRWRDALSRMRPEDVPGGMVSASAGASVDAVTAPAASRTNFFDRWVEIAQRAPPVTAKAQPADLAANARAAEPLVTPIRVMLGLLVLLLALGAFELVIRRPIRGAD